MKLDAKTVRLLAAEATLDERTVRRALEGGIETLRSEFSRERLRAAAKKLSVTLK